MSKLFPLNSQVHFNSFMDMLWYGIMEADWVQTKIEWIVMVAWAVWTNWNKFSVWGVKKSSQQVVYGALDFLAKFQECGCAASGPSTKTQTSWTPPPHTRYKINVDGVVFVAQKSAGIGVIIRDSDGSVIGACSKKLRFPLGAVEVEAKAIEFGLQFAKDLLIQDFILEVDSLMVFNALSETSSPPSLIAAMIYGSISTSHEFRHVDFSHVQRQGNCQPIFSLNML